MGKALTRPSSGCNRRRMTPWTLVERATSPDGTRLELLRRTFSDLGLSDTEASDRAWLAYGFYLGHHQLRESDTAPSARPRDMSRIVELLAGGASGPR